jgi:hypothetical protein
MESDMYRNGNCVAAGLIASLWAGPIFIATLALAQYVRQTPEAVSIPGLDLQTGLALLAFLIPMTIIVGFLLSVIPNVFGAVLMANLSDRLDSARSPVAWVATGTALGTLIAWLLVINPYYGEPDLVSLVPFIATSAACAGICWRKMGWRDRRDVQG